MADEDYNDWCVEVAEEKSSGITDALSEWLNQHGDDRTTAEVSFDSRLAENLNLSDPEATDWVPGAATPTITVPKSSCCDEAPSPSNVPPPLEFVGRVQIMPSHKRGKVPHLIPGRSVVGQGNPE